MRTTLNLKDSLLFEAKRRAVEERRTLTQIIEEALHFYLQGGHPIKGYRFTPLAKALRARPGVDIADRDSLYRAMEESDDGS